LIVSEKFLDLEKRFLNYKSTITKHTHRMIDFITRCFILTTIKVQLFTYWNKKADINKDSIIIIIIIRSTCDNQRLEDAMTIHN